jgi:hypothetical protein
MRAAQAATAYGPRGCEEPPAELRHRFGCGRWRAARRSFVFAYADAAASCWLAGILKSASQSAKLIARRFDGSAKAAANDGDVTLRK